MQQLQIYCLLLSIVFFTSVTADGCDDQQCIVPKHYLEIGCTPIHEDGSRCATRFDCSFLANRDPQKCYYKGIAHDLNTELNPDSKNPCSVGCRCNNINDRASLTCVTVECPELFQGPLEDPNCYRLYSLDKCCSTGTQCISVTNTTGQPNECQYGGKTYKEGQVIYPEDAPCKRCVCQSGFNGTLDGPWCEEISCGIELHYSRQISDGCTPIYYGTSGCCPIDWRCPHASDTVVASAAASTKNVEHKCKFGSLELRVGDKLSGIPNKCVKCDCSVPPLVTCTHKPHNECQV